MQNRKLVKVGRAFFSQTQKPYFIRTLIPQPVNTPFVMYDIGVIRLRGRYMETLAEFHQEIAATFQFPLVYDNSFTMLELYLKDLNWLFVSNFYLIIVDSNNILCAESVLLRKKFWKLLEQVAEYWANEQNHKPFHINLVCTDWKSSISNICLEIIDCELEIEDSFYIRAAEIELPKYCESLNKLNVVADVDAQIFNQLMRPYIFKSTLRAKEFDNQLLYYRSRCKDLETCVVLLRGERMITWKGLFQECASALKFGEHFGHNGAALRDCMYDTPDTFYYGKRYIIGITNSWLILSQGEKPDDKSWFATVLWETCEAAKKYYGCPCHVIMQCEYKEQLDPFTQLGDVFSKEYELKY